MEFKTVIDDSAFRAPLERLIHANTDLAPLMRSIKGFMLDRVEENFAQEGRPKWAPLSPVTVKRRGNSGPILQRSGQLAASVSGISDATSATVGTNKIYAKTQQFGAKKGQFGQFSMLLSAKQKTTFKRSPVINIPWGDIPARPFVALTTEDQGEGGLLGLVIRYEKNAAG
jgi:phage virion morphogenesis protein